MFYKGLCVSMEINGLKLVVNIFYVVFWVIMSITFFILYSKGNQFTENFKEATNIVGKKVLLHPTRDGDLVVDDARITLKPALDATSSIFKLSGYATVISIIAAVFTAVIGLIETLNYFS